MKGMVQFRIAHVAGTVFLHRLARLQYRLMKMGAFQYVRAIPVLWAPFWKPVRGNVWENGPWVTLIDGRDVRLNPPSATDQ
jgi:hypothetical protein